jgi:hypothetical protein
MGGGRVSRKAHREPASPNTPGDLSLPLGILALLCSFVPVLGEFLATPTGLAAIVLGVVGVLRNERGRATNYGQSLIGATLGIMALLIVLLMTAVTASPQ